MFLNQLSINFNEKNMQMVFIICVFKMNKIE